MAVYHSENTRAYKPRPEMFHRALHRNGLKSDVVIHIGDSYGSDVLGAHPCGIGVVWVNRKKRTRPGQLMQLAGCTLSEIVWD
ncbi:MAG: HAD family hydrolase [Verrucomicrobiales bacterium]